LLTSFKIEFHIFILKCVEYKDLYENKIDSSCNEIDTCGVFLKHVPGPYQNLVFLTDLTNSNTIICVSFPKKSEVIFKISISAVKIFIKNYIFLKFFGYENLFKNSNVIACLNLRYSRKKELLKYPCLMATEMSVFTQKIKNSLKFLLSKYTSLSELANSQVL
jgi:hypothetical protein